VIRINLAGAKSAGQPILNLQIESGGFTPAEAQKQGLIRLIIIVLAPLALWLYQENTLPALISERNSKSQTLMELQEYNAKMARSVQEIKKFKEDEAKIQARIDYLDKLSKNRLREIKILDLIQQVIPEKVWLTTVESRSGRLSLSGMAMSDFDISIFMESLAKSVFFVDVNLMSSVETTFDGLDLKKFEILCVTEKPTK
jgi:type IV pilus assembly protein PilN